MDRRIDDQALLRASKVRARFRVRVQVRLTVQVRIQLTVGDNLGSGKGVNQISVISV